MSNSNQFDNFLFDSTPENEQEELSFLKKKQKNQDGIYRPVYDEASDPKVGYKATIRFLKNIKRDGEKGEAAVTKHVHYVNFKDYPELSGYYDCGKNYTETCPLCSTYWKLHNSRNQVEVEKAELINRQTKYYSYVMIMEDEQHPEFVGKILVFPYGYKIKEKISAEYNGEVTGERCNIFNLENGKDFKLIIKENKTPLKTFANYDSSQFLQSSPIKIFNEKTNKFIPAPLDEGGKISDKKWQMKIKEILLSRDEKVNLEDHMAGKEWTDEEKEKISKVISILNGDDLVVATQSVKNVSKKETPLPALDDELDDEFFNSFSSK